MNKRRSLPAPALPAEPLPPDALGESEAFIEFQERLSEVAKVDRPVLIVGERGTGKELAAARLHYLSRRWEGPLVALNCAALAPSLLEAELFGHEAGAFTGASQQRRGRFETAGGGTLFLDEIGLIPMEVQEKIMRVVEYNTFERVGSSLPVVVDVRILGATNANLPALVAAGKFKADLLDRLSFEVLSLPPLRERRGDIPLLAQHFAARMAAELGRSTPEFTRVALATLEAHPWPGNVRELKNVVERAVFRCAGSEIREIEFNPFRHGPPPPPDRGPSGEPSPDTPAEGGRRALRTRSLPEAVRELELGLIRRSLDESRYHQRTAATRLGLSYHQFRALYRKYRTELAPDLEGSGRHPDSLPETPSTRSGKDG